MNLDKNNKGNTPRQRDEEREAMSHEQRLNPFENNQSVEKDIEQSREDLDGEQQFKDASTERD